MNIKQQIIASAIAAAFPFSGAMAQSNADLQREIDQLKAQIKALMEKVEAVSQKNAVDPQEFNRLVQKVDLAEENSITSGFQGLKFKGVIEATFLHDRNNAAGALQGFSSGNGYGGTGMFEISKETDDGKGIKWMLRLTPGGFNAQGDASVHEASVSLPIGFGDTTRLMAGLVPDWSGYEYSFGHQNPLVTHNLLFTYAAAVNYAGVGLSYEVGDWTAKWMVANIDAPGTTKRVPGIAYNAYWGISEFSYLNFSGAHSRETRRFDLFEVDAGYTRGDLALNAQFSLGDELGAAANGRIAKWWGLSGFAGFKLTPRLQALVRADYLHSRKNGGGMYFNDGTFGPELDSTGAVIDPNRGANRYALSFGFNYAVNANTQWKTELRLDRSTGFNFTDAAGNPSKRNTTLGTAIVVSF
jgi:hypothetical protein